MPEVALNHEISGPEGAHVVLMGAALGTSLALWEPQAAVLSERFRVVRFDMRGHGASPWAPGPYTIADLGGDVRALMDRLGVERASFVGLSLGGMVGMWLAAALPERVERLALVCTSAHVPPRDTWEERAAAVEEAGTTQVVADSVIGRWLTPAFREARPDAAARLRSMLTGTSPEGYAACARAIGAMDLRGDLPRIAAPTLVVAGEEDPSTPPEHGEAIANAVPDAQYELLSPCAHIAAVEREDDVGRLLYEHLEPAV